jgi:hypothetical protein
MSRAPSTSTSCSGDGIEGVNGFYFEFFTLYLYTSLKQDMGRAWLP